MEFVVLITVLMLRGLLSLMPEKCHDHWFFSLKARAVTLFRPKARHLYDPESEEPGSITTEPTPSNTASPRWFAGTGVFFVSVILPVVGLSVVLAVLEQFAWGFPAFVLSILVLLYSLGRKDSYHWFTRFQIAWRQKDLQGAYQYASELLPGENIKDEKQLYQRVFSRLINMRFQDFFLITFWFMWLGAEGALLARLMILFCDKSQTGVAAEKTSVISASRIRNVQYLFEWLPAKLMGLSFMLTGHFVHCSHQWISSLLNKKHSHEMLLTHFALGALGEKVEGCESGPLPSAEDSTHKDEQLQELEALLRRSSVLWVIAIAVTVVLMEL
ncbi:regulatory signaling modulator protein AmpE [Oceanospirillum linum]|uniref:Regulatory signaling modulator protein AmpE n=1 Tax=Oceanospirillum linum TaxID=966 RepID=A0A1T1HAU5_OCELI|nr:regulatory signaling modulator protein AmpE [Oceanospirillum linum]OOV86979.1 hypothetical protein BTA35_0208120 [Oceanospirillum linum]SEF70361.1 AmpE protein [Oleiphilus messinensis]SMP15251.1 AmpE protein [Oceanospirillum linum]